MFSAEYVNIFWATLTFILVSVVIIIAYFYLKSSAPIKFSSVKNLKRIKPSWKQKLRPALIIIRILAIAAICLALAHPREGVVQTSVSTSGIALQLVIDRSSSMGLCTYYGDGRKKELKSRFNIVKDVVKKFIIGDGDRLNGRKGDFMQLISFARFVDEKSSFTVNLDGLAEMTSSLEMVRTDPCMPESEYEIFRSENPSLTRHLKAYEYTDKGLRCISINKIRIDVNKGYRNLYQVVNSSEFNALIQDFTEREEDRTAIGDAVYFGTLKLLQSDEVIKEEINIDDEYKMKSKVMIILTDGENNAGQDVREAADFAKANGVKVYTIAVISKKDEVFICDDKGLFGSQRQTYANPSIDTSDLQYLSKETGGHFFIAKDGNEILDVYEKIDQLEKSQTEEIFTEYKEIYTGWVWIAILLLFFEILIANTILFRVP
jgi:hypothetical protein